MPRIPLLFAFSLAALAFACSDHKCPPPYMTFGDTCRLCPPGHERERGMCVPILDGGDEPVTADDAGEGEEVEPDADEPTASGDKPGDEDTGSNERAGAPCYHDSDGDGVGAGEPVDCASGGPEALADTDTDCDDNDAERSPSLSDVCGDGIDNDCDGTPDDESNNACGGPCSTQLHHQPGETCDNGLRGACLRSGIYECRGPTTTACNAPNVTVSSELCGDDIDNDCDGSADEADAVDATVWYEDCDGDGYSALTDALISSGIGTRRACARPAPTTNCTGWTDRRPQTGSTWDCDDTSTAYNPRAFFGVPPEGRTRIDLNCDGIEEKEDVVGVPGFLIGTYANAPRCPASFSCTACGTNLDGSQRPAAQWIDSDGQPTDTQPPCSRSMNDRFGSRETEALLSGFCPGGEWVSSAQGRSIQPCR